LRDDIAREVLQRESLADDQTDRYGGVEVAARYMADRERHREDREAECERHADKAYAEGREGRREDRAAAASEDQPECAEKLSCYAFGWVHFVPR